MLRSSVESDFYHGLLKLCDDMDMPLEGLHTETGPGVIEAAIKYTDVVAAADRAVTFKTFYKVFAARQGKMPTLMATCATAPPEPTRHLHPTLSDPHINP